MRGGPRRPARPAPARPPGRLHAGQGSATGACDPGTGRAACAEPRARIERCLRHRAGRPRVLLVDDDARLVHIVGLYLQVQHFEVVRQHGEEASGCSARPPRPRHPRRHDAGHRRDQPVPADPRHARGRALPIIVFTALSDSATCAARDAGANQVITKPFNLTGLGAAVEALLPTPPPPARSRGPCTSTAASSASPTPTRWATSTTPASPTLFEDARIGLLRSIAAADDLPTSGMILARWRSTTCARWCSTTSRCRCSRGWCASAPAPSRSTTPRAARRHLRPRAVGAGGLRLRPARSRRSPPNAPSSRPPGRPPRRLSGRRHDASAGGRGRRRRR